MVAHSNSSPECGCRNLVRNICSMYATWGDLQCYERQTYPAVITAYLSSGVRDSNISSSQSRCRFQSIWLCQGQTLQFRLGRVYIDTCLRNVADCLVNDILDSLACPLDGEWVFAHRRTPTLPECIVPVDEQLQVRFEDVDGCKTLRTSKIVGDVRYSHR